MRLITIIEKIKPLLCQACGESLEEGTLDFFGLTEELEANTFPKVIEVIKTEKVFSDINVSMIILALWLPRLKNGRAMCFYPSTDSNKTDFLKKLAEFNIEIFGRGTTLSERLLNFAKNINNESVKIDINYEDQSFGIGTNRIQDNILSFNIGHIWEKLEPKNEFKKKRDGLISSGDIDIIDTTRLLKIEFSDEFKRQCNTVVNNLLKREKYLKDLLSLIIYLKNPEEDVQDENFENKEVPFSQNYDIIMSFIKFIQALAHFLPEISDQAKKVCSIGYLPKEGSNSQSPTNRTSIFPSRGVAISFVGNSAMRSFDKSKFSFLSYIYKTISSKVGEARKEFGEELEGDLGLFREAVKKVFLKK